jgi:hypothetical protein
VTTFTPTRGPDVANPRFNRCSSGRSWASSRQQRLGSETPSASQRQASAPLHRSRALNVDSVLCRSRTRSGSRHPPTQQLIFTQQHLSLESERCQMLMSSRDPVVVDVYVDRLTEPVLRRRDHEPGGDSRDLQAGTFEKGNAINDRNDEIDRPVATWISRGIQSRGSSVARRCSNTRRGCRFRSRWMVRSSSTSSWRPQRRFERQTPLGTVGRFVDRRVR